MADIDELLELQDGVISRRQALAAGLSVTEVKRRVRRREWTPVHPGVYVDHTGPLTWRQRAWAAVLVCWPAALDGESAVRAHEGPGRRTTQEDGPIRVVIPHGRTVEEPDGVLVRRCRRYQESVQSHLSPPRLRFEDAVLHLADSASDVLATVAVLADACGGRRTTAARLRRRLAELGRARQRRLIADLLDDVASGVCSVLEHGYLTLVERPHGLPRGSRQVAAVTGGGRRMFRDVLHGGRRPPWRLIVELDGRMHHSSPQAHDRDLERDLDAAVDREETVRLGYGQVFRRPCLTAAKLARVMQRLGWRGELRRCENCP